MFKACMFDLDGTLANTLNSIAYFGNTALKNSNYKAINTEDYKMLIGNGAVTLINRMLEKTCGNTEDYEIVRKNYDELYEKNPLYLVEPYEGIPELLKSLIESEVMLAVISNKPDDMTREVVKNLFGLENFQIVRGQRDGVPIKPDPTAPLEILKEMNISPEDCLYIGDSGVDMETGANAKMTTVGVTWGFRGEEELKAHGGKYIVNTPKEILNIVKDSK